MAEFGLLSIMIFGLHMVWLSWKLLFKCCEFIKEYCWLLCYVFTKFNQSLHKSWKTSLHKVYILKIHKACTEFTPGYHSMLTECKLSLGATPLPPPKKMKWPYLSNQSCVWDEPKNRFNNSPWPTNAGLWCIWPIRHHMTNDKKNGQEAHLWCTTTQKNKCLISANANAPCTMLLEGRVGHVWACPDAPGRFCSSGKTGPNTDSLKIQYPKNSLFRPGKWAPAPPGNW